MALSRSLALTPKPLSIRQHACRTLQRLGHTPSYLRLVSMLAISKKLQRSPLMPPYMIFSGCPKKGILPRMVQCRFVWCQSEGYNNTRIGDCPSKKLLCLGATDMIQVGQSLVLRQVTGNGALLPAALKVPPPAAGRPSWLQEPLWQLPCHLHNATRPVPCSCMPPQACPPGQLPWAQHASGKQAAA